MFWATVSEGIRLKAWKTNPIRSRRRIVSRRSLSFASWTSPSATLPDVGRSRPAATCRNVLLPDPDGPMIAVNDPRASATLIPSRATTSLSPRPWTLRTSCRATAGASLGGGGRTAVCAALSIMVRTLCAARVAQRAVNRPGKFAKPTPRVLERRPPRVASVAVLLDVALDALLEGLQLLVELVGRDRLVRLRLADEPRSGVDRRAPGGLGGIGVGGAARV